MANSEHWDTGTSTPTDGNKGAPRIWNKIGGTWERQWEPSVNVSGSWKKVNKIWTKTGDEWKPVFWAPEVGEELDYGYLQVQPHYWYKAYCKVKYLGGDPLDAASWQLNIHTTTYNGNPSSAGNTSGWITGSAGNKSIYTHYNSTDGGFDVDVRVGGMDYDVEDYSTTVTGAPAGAFCPVYHLSTRSNNRYARRSYDNRDELDHDNVATASNPWSYSLT